MARAYGRAPKGERVVEDKPMNTPPNTTALAALGVEGLLTCMCVEGPANGETFNLFIERLLVPALNPGLVVLMDNMKTNKSARVLEAIEGAGAGLVFLPAYSPDLNPIEECWAKVKGILRAKAARVKDKFMAALKKAIEEVTPDNAMAWIKYSGYCFTSE